MGFACSTMRDEQFVQSLGRKPEGKRPHGET
jgi:hypothetical protein